MKRVMENGEWTLFSPSDVPDLHDKFGKAFEKAYVDYEAQGRARRAEAVQEDPGGAAVAQDAVDAVRDRASVDHVQGPVQPPLPQQHVGVVHSSNLCTEITLNTGPDEIAVCNLGSVNLPAHLDQRRAARHGEAEAHDRHRDAHARQRDRPQLLRGQQGAQLQLQAPPGGPGHHGLPGLPAHAAHPVRLAGGGRVRRPLDGSGRLLRVLGLDRARRGARAATRPSRARCGTAASCRSTRSSCSPRSAAATSKCDMSSTLDWDALRERIKQVGMRNSNCLAIAPTATIANIIGAVAVDRADLPEPVREIEPVGRVHGGQRVPGARPEEARPVGRGHDRRPQVLRRHAREDRPHPAGRAQPLRHRVRGRAEVAGRMRGARGRSGSTSRSR